MSDNPNWRDRAWDQQDQGDGGWRKSSSNERRLDRRVEQEVSDWSRARSWRPGRAVDANVVDEGQTRLDLPLANVRRVQRKVEHRDIGYKLLEIKSQVPPKEAVMFCYQGTFCRLLADESLDFERIELILSTVSNALRADASLNSVRQALKDELLRQPFLSKTCKDSLSEKLTAETVRSSLLMKSLQNYLDIFHYLCAMDPLVCKSLIKPVKLVKQLLKGALVDNENFRPIYELYSQATVEVERQEKEKETLERRRREVSRSGRMQTDEKPAGDFRDIPIYPTEDDLTAVVYLRPNRTDNAFDSVDDYLDIQFRLLREDYIYTIRQGIHEFRQNPRLRGPNRFRSGDIRMYQNLMIGSADFGQNGLMYTLQLDTQSRMFERIDWKSSQRLKYGSLLCLSQDGFKDNVLFAVIFERKDEDITEGRLQIQFLPRSQESFFKLSNHRLDRPFVAAESTAYYEPYKHVLKGMQGLSQYDLPFVKHIIRTETDLSTPAYAEQGFTYRLLTADNTLTPPVAVHSDIETEWPSAKVLGFNESQYEAYKMALTKDFVVIQGPPGTGKTFIGLKIVEMLLYNLYNVPYAEQSRLTSTSDLVKPPSLSQTDRFNRKMYFPGGRLNQMLIVCFTNHALDQFLEGMLSFCPIGDMVRVGTRSKNERLAACNHKNKDRRVQRSKQLSIAFQEYYERKEAFFKNYHIDHLNKASQNSRQNILPHDCPGLLYNYPEFFRQLEAFAIELEERGRELQDAMAIWLDSDIEEAVEKRFLSQQKKLNGQDDEAGLDQQVEAEGDWQKVKLRPETVRKFDSKVREQINRADVMTEEEMKKLRDRVLRDEMNIVKDLSLTNRWRLYRYFLIQYQSEMKPNMQLLQEEYSTLVEEYEGLKMQDDIESLRAAKVIGMTTTGAARLQSVLQEVGPEVIVVEEAAEVLESHIITALSRNCEHLILIGDHKQLRPNPTVYALAKDYHLDLSLFERMVNNGLPVKTLNIQHRMRPEVSKYIRGHIYDKLDDHCSVLERDPVEGVKCPVFFFNHNNPEVTDEATMSHSNKFEAEMIVEFTSYLLKQKSYEADDITIITMYTGQLLLIKQMMPKAEGRGVQVTSVDNFQGEENKIVIISLVRSNPDGTLGFVKIENRVCVSLSRAQYGMYVFGDFGMLARGSPLWRDIVKEASEAQEIGRELHLSCQIHNNPAIIEKPEDFRTKVSAGGCQMPCNRLLDCGHVCTMLCHSKDLKHEQEYKCTKPCTKLLPPCKHLCRGKCYQECPPCLIQTAKTLDCGHTCKVACYELQRQTDCIQPCPEVLDCGHACSARCSQPCSTTCSVKVEQMCFECNKLKQMPCYMARDSLRSLTTFGYKCDTPCNMTLDCGHKCTGTCYRCTRDGHQSCKDSCGKTLLCGHGCRDSCLSCTDRGHCGNCNRSCDIICSHGCICSSKCCEDCVFSVQTTNLTCQWGCEHSKCERSCGLPCSFIPCDRSCDKMVACKQCQQEYPCVGLCGDFCPPLCPQCDKPNLLEMLRERLGLMIDSVSAGSRWIVLQDCKHLVPEAYINDLVYGVSAHTLVKCPYKSCDKWILNTPRYASRTRPVKAISHLIDLPQKVDQKVEARPVMPQTELLQKKKSRQLGASSHKLPRVKREPPPPPPWMVLPQQRQSLLRAHSAEQMKDQEPVLLAEPPEKLADNLESVHLTESSRELIDNM